MSVLWRLAVGTESYLMVQKPPSKLGGNSLTEGGVVMVHVIHKIKRPGTELIKTFSEQASATVHEAMGMRGAMHSSIRPVYSGIRLCGSAITVKSQAGDNLMLQKALYMAKPGDVLVADMGQFTEGGSWGEIMTTQAKVGGVAGFVTNGSVRDTLQIKEMGFPVFSKAISIKGTVKETLGLVNHPISCAGVVVNPGDIILGDDDGVVVIPLQEAEEILQKSKERVAKEIKLMERIKAGETLFEIFRFGDVLHRKGCVEESEN
jgi:4-hydroxy-4-methyl-2-oxoglutarate aldolase